MQWSKLKSKIKDLISPELRECIDFHVTSYRKSHDGADKVWIVIDGVRIFSCTYYRSERATAEAFYSGLRGKQIKSHLVERRDSYAQRFGEAMRPYLDMPIADALSSSNPLVKAFAIVDRRVGKRVIARLEIPDSAHTLIKAFYKLRCPMHIQRSLAADGAIACFSSNLFPSV